MRSCVCVCVCARARLCICVFILFHRKGFFRLQRCLSPPKTKFQHADKLDKK